MNAHPGPDLADNTSLMAHAADGHASLAQITRLPPNLIVGLAKQNRLGELFDPATGKLADPEVLRERFMPQTPYTVDEFFTKYAHEIEVRSAETESGDYVVVIVVERHDNPEAAEAARDRVEAELAALTDHRIDPLNRSSHEASS
jgi:hypothetical protein